MPLIEQNPGWANAVSALVAGYGLSQQARAAKEEKQRQQQIDAQNAALANAQISGQQARTKLDQQQLAQNQQLFGMQQRQSGVNPQTGQPFNYGFTPQQMQQGLNTPDLSKRAAFLGILAARAGTTGATQQASQFLKQAYDTGNQAIKTSDESLKFQQFAEKQLNDAAQRAHLSNQDAAAFQRISVEAARLQNEVQRGAISANNAQTNLLLRMKEFGLRSQEFKMNQQKFKFEQNTKPNTANLSALTTIRGNKAFRQLPPSVSGLLSSEIEQYGISNVMQSLQKISQGAKNSSGISPQQAQQMLDAMNTAGQ